MQPASKTRIPAIAEERRPYRLYPNASVGLWVAERKRFSRVTAIPYTLTLLMQLYPILE